MDIFITRSYNCKSEGVVSSHYILLWLGCQNASSSDSFFIEIFCLRQPVSALPCAATCLAHVHAVAFEMLTTNRSKIRLLATSLKNRIPDYISCLKYLAAKIRRVLHSIRMTHLYSQLSCEPTIYTSTRQNLHIACELAVRDVPQGKFTASSLMQNNTIFAAAQSALQVVRISNTRKI